MKNPNLFLLISFIISFFCHGQITKIDSIKTQLSKAKADTSKVLLLNSLAYEYMNTDPGQMLSLSKEALALSKELDYPFGEASANNAAGIANLFLANYSDALIYYKKALEYYEQNNLKNKLASVFSNMGVVFLRKGDYKNAIEYTLKSLKIKEALGNKNALTSAYINLGTLYCSFGDTTESLLYQNKALKIASEVDNKESMSMCYYNMGNIYAVRKLYSLALEYYQKSLLLKRKLNDSQWIASTLNGIGLVYFEMNHMDSARKYFESAVKLSVENDVKLEISDFSINLGRLDLSQMRFDEAEKNFLTAFEVAQSLGAKVYIKDAVQELANLYYLKKDYQKAYEYGTLHSIYRDSVFTEDTNKALAEMQLKYNDEKRENELLLSKVELEEKENKLKSQRQLIYIVVLGLALALTVIGLIYKSYKEKQKTNQQLYEKNKDMIDGINYAKRIQEAILPSEQSVISLLPDSFVLYKPKDIVRGDFYFIEPIRMNDGTQFIGFAAADCTGHGVSGAFMSMLGYSILKRSLTEKSVNTPGEALDYLNRQLHISLRQHEKEVSIKDGMDISFCVLIPDKNILYFAGANNPVYIISNNSLSEIKGDKQPVGHSEKQKNFTTHEIKLNKGDMVYIFSDGYADQFGGPRGKKFKYKQMQELMLANSHKPPNEQKEIFDKTIENWCGKLEQVDDMLMIGVRV